MLNIIMCRKKEILIIIFILTFALLATYNIYYKFNNSESTDYNTDTLDITFYNKEADQINITKLTPVTDSVGLSSNAYTFKIKNNTNKSIKYSVNINDNTRLYDKHKCRDYEIPKNIIRLSIHKNKEKNNIYNLSDLVNGNIVNRIIKANSEEEYTIRVWISNKANQTTGTKMHYHGIIKVIDEGVLVATTIK